MSGTISQKKCVSNLGFLPSSSCNDQLPIFNILKKQVHNLGKEAKVLGRRHNIQVQ